MRSLLTVIWMLLCASVVAQDKPPQFSLLDWNVEAGGSDVETILKQLKELEPFDCVGLSEVPTTAADKFTSRWPGDSFIMGSVGGNSRLMLAWNPQVFEKISTQELKKVGEQDFAVGLQAAPLVAELRHKQTKQEVLIVMLHLARGSAELRKKQALLLIEWAKAQTRPIIAIGGFNFDYDYVKHKGNESFEAFTAVDTFQWVKPKSWADTNWSDRNKDGKDDYPIRCWTMCSSVAWLSHGPVVVRSLSVPAIFLIRIRPAIIGRSAFKRGSSSA